MNLDEARQMLAAGQAHPKSVVRFCPPPMGMGCDRTMRRLLNEERFVGDVRQVSLISATGALLDPEAPLTWRLQTEQSGQNVLTLGIYYEVLERWLGPTRRITAVTANWTPTRKHPNSGELKPSDLPESVNIIAELESGAIGTYIFNGVSSHAPTDHLAIHGTEGSLVYDFNGDIAQERIEGAKLGRESMDTIPIPDSERGNWTVEADFIHEIRHGEARGLLPGLQRAYNYMALIDATHRSAANNRGVEV
jgi:predicted dehydrogenase